MSQLALKARQRRITVLQKLGTPRRERLSSDARDRILAQIMAAG